MIGTVLALSLLGFCPEESIFERPILGLGLFEFLFQTLDSLQGIGVTALPVRRFVSKLGHLALDRFDRLPQPGHLPGKFFPQRLCRCVVR